MIELWFLFSLIWSICASVDEDSRKKMDNFLREIEGQFPAKVCSLNRMENLFIQQKLLGEGERKDYKENDKLWSVLS